MAMRCAQACCETKRAAGIRQERKTKRKKPFRFQSSTNHNVQDTMLGRQAQLCLSTTPNPQHTGISTKSTSTRPHRTRPSFSTRKSTSTTLPTAYQRSQRSQRSQEDTIIPPGPRGSLPRAAAPAQLPDSSLPDDAIECRCTVDICLCPCLPLPLPPLPSSPSAVSCKGEARSSTRRTQPSSLLGPPLPFASLQPPCRSPPSVPPAAAAAQPPSSSSDSRTLPTLLHLAPTQTTKTLSPSSTAADLLIP